MKTKLLRLRWFALAAFSTTLAFGQAPAPKLEKPEPLPYRITRGDTISVAVYGEPELTSGGNRVEARGTITLQLIKEIQVAGLTVIEAQTAIEKAYIEGRFLREPQVKITIDGYAPRMVRVSGAVNQQGNRELPPDRQMTIKELILAAGGFSDTAKGTEVKVTRTLPDGSLKTFILDVQSALLGRERASAADANFVLEPEDIVYVPQKII